MEPHQHLPFECLRTVREQFANGSRSDGRVRARLSPVERPYIGGPQWLPKSPTSTIEGMGSLLLASGAHVIKIYHSFTIRRDYRSTEPVLLLCGPRWNLTGTSVASPRARLPFLSTNCKNCKNCKTRKPQSVQTAF